MRVNLRKYLWVQMTCLGLWPSLAFAQFSDFAQNLENCKAGREACDRSKLNQAESANVALARHASNVSNCRNGYDPCDRSKLTKAEAVAWAVADHQRNVSSCNDGMASCDLSKLTPSEARDSSIADRRRTGPLISQLRVDPRWPMRNATMSRVVLRRLLSPRVFLAFTKWSTCLSNVLIKAGTERKVRTSEVKTSR